jgi:hypothetical protein
MHQQTTEAARAHAQPNGEVMGAEQDDGATARYFVTDGEATVGPVDGELLVRGIHAGKVPLEAQVWCTAWGNWKPIAEFAAEIGMLPSADEAKASSKLARVSDLYPLQLPPVDAQRQTLGEARTLNEAASKFLTLCAAVTGADCGWVHVFSRQSGGAMITLQGIGCRAQFGIGRTIDPSDQALRAARDGRTVISEPIPGVVGSAVAARILATGESPDSVVMTPVLCGGQLLVMLELGVSNRPSGFTATDAAVTEQMARDFSAIARKRGWHRA